MNKKTYEVSSNFKSNGSIKFALNFLVPIPWSWDRKIVFLSGNHECLGEFFGQTCWLFCCFKISPPSAWVAAMSAMEYKTPLKHLDQFLETSLKHILDTVGTPLKLPELSMKRL